MLKVLFNLLLRILCGCDIVALIYLGNGFLMFTDNLSLVNAVLLVVALIILETMLDVILDRESKKNNEVLCG